jgi:serine/threonine protein kinase
MLGGMAIVYGVEDPKTKRRYAAKTYRNDDIRHVELERLFRREMEVVSSVGEHRNLLLPLFVRTFSIRSFLFFDFVEGGDCGPLLCDWIDAETMSFTQVVSLAYQLACGMEHLSADTAVAHLDLKPGNIFVTPEQVLKIADFGLAREVARYKTTPEAERRGALAYMAPEHLENKPVDERADIYSFGVIFYQMLTGCLPFDTEGFADPLEAIRAFHRRESFSNSLYWSSELPHPYTTAVTQGGMSAKFSGDITTILSAALAFELNDRFRSFSDVRRAFETAFGSLLDSLRKASKPALASEEELRIGLLQQSIGNHSQALIHFNRFLRAFPEDPTALEAAALSFRALGDTATAERFTLRAQSARLAGRGGTGNDRL